MFLEGYAAYNYYQDLVNSEEFAHRDDYTSTAGFIFLVIFYIVLILFIAIRWPLGNNVLVSLLFALFLTPIFIILKFVELALNCTCDRWFSKKGCT